MNCSIIEKKITDYTLAHRDKVGDRIDQSESSIAPAHLVEVAQEFIQPIKNARFVTIVRR